MKEQHLKDIRKFITSTLLTKKTGILFTLGSLVIAATIIFIVFRSIRHFSFSFTADFLRYEIVLLISLLAYIILHELTHGAVYKMLTYVY